MFKIHTLGKRLFTTRAVETWKTTSDRFNQKIKGTIVEKWVGYWKLVLKDYKDVGKSVQQEIKEKPLKAAAYFTGAAFVGLCLQLNPDLQSFRAKYIQSANDLGLVAVTVANPQATEHLKLIERCFNRKYIRYTNLGLFSIVWVDKYSEECDYFETNCSYLKIPYWDIKNHVLDVGFLNVWWVISRKMLDYDINY